jgi:hypothetical protein
VCREIILPRSDSKTQRHSVGTMYSILIQETRNISLWTVCGRTANNPQNERNSFANNVCRCVRTLSHEPWDLQFKLVTHYVASANLTKFVVTVAITELKHTLWTDGTKEIFYLSYLRGVKCKWKGEVFVNRITKITNTFVNNYQLH